MNYTIVFKNGKIKRLIGVNYCDVGSEYITIYLFNNQIQFDIRKEDIASVVFYP